MISKILPNRIDTLITDGKIINKINRNTNLYYVNEKEIDTNLLNLQNTSSIRPDKSFYTPTIFIPIPSTENPLTSFKKTPITAKLTNSSPDNHKTSQNSSNLTYTSSNDIHIEMIALKSFVVDQIYMLKKKSDENKILSNNESKALINNLIDQINFLKNELRSKGIIMKLIIENSKYKNEYFQNKNNSVSLYVIIMSRTCFRVNLHSIVAWMTKNSLLETDPISDAYVTAMGFEPTTT